MTGYLIRRLLFIPTAVLAVMAVVIATAVAIPCGVIAAVRPDTLLDYGLRGFSMIFESMPNFWLGLLALFALAVVFDWKPPIYYKDLWDAPWPNRPMMFFPALVVLPAKGFCSVCWVGIEFEIV